MVRKIMGYLDLNHRKEDRCDMKELWDMIYKTARRIALHQLEREIGEGLRLEIKNMAIHYSDPQDWELEDCVIKVRTRRD